VETVMNRVTERLVSAGILIVSIVLWIVAICLMVQD